MDLRLKSGAVAAAVLSGIMLTAPGASAQQAQTKAAAQHAQATMPSQYQQVRGDISTVKTVKVRGSKQPNTLVLLETKGGQKRVVDLGAELQGATLQKGQQLSARGRAVSIGGEKVILLADSFRYGNKTYDATRPAMKRAKN